MQEWILEATKKHQPSQHGKLENVLDAEEQAADTFPYVACFCAALGNPSTCICIAFAEEGARTGTVPGTIRIS